MGLEPRHFARSRTDCAAIVTILCYIYYVIVYVLLAYSDTPGNFLSLLLEDPFSPHQAHFPPANLFLLDAACWLFSTTGARDTTWLGKGMTRTDQHQVNAGLPSTDEPLNANRDEGSLEVFCHFSFSTPCLYLCPNLECLSIPPDD